MFKQLLIKMHVKPALNYLIFGWTLFKLCGIFLLKIQSMFAALPTLVRQCPHLHHSGRNPVA